MANTYDGYNVRFTMAADVTLQFTPKTITIPGVSTGGEINVTPLAATAWRTFVSKALKTLTDMKVSAFYDTAIWPDLISVEVGVNTLFTITFQDTHTLAFYGFVSEASFNANAEGEAPLVELTIKATNRHSTTGAETAPAYV